MEKFGSTLKSPNVAAIINSRTSSDIDESLSIVSNLAFRSFRKTTRETVKQIDRNVRQATQRAASYITAPLIAVPDSRNARRFEFPPRLIIGAFLSKCGVGDKNNVRTKTKYGGGNIWRSARLWGGLTWFTEIHIHRTMSQMVYHALYFLSSKAVKWLTVEPMFQWELNIFFWI